MFEFLQQGNMFRQSILKSTINCQITPSPQRQQRTCSSAKQIRRSGGCGYSRYQQSAPPLCARCSSWWAPCQTGHFPPAPPRNQCDSLTPLRDTERNRQRQAIRPTSFYIIKLNEITFFVQREQFFFTNSVEGRGKILKNGPRTFSRFLSPTYHP